MWAKIITIKRTKELNYFSLCALNLFNTRFSQFELNYWNKWTFPWHSNLLRCTCTHTLTGNFIRYTLLVSGWTPFAFRTALILRGIDSTSCWKHSSEILVYIDMIASRSCCRFVGCTSMMRISRSTTSQRCSIGLRSGDCGGHLSKVNSLSCSRNQSEMIWALWHGALSCWK